MKKHFTILLMTLVSVGCANNFNNKEKTANVDKSDLICVSEKPTGSNISKRVCRTPAQIELERMRAALATDKLRRTGATAPEQSQ